MKTIIDSEDQKTFDKIEILKQKERNIKIKNVQDIMKIKNLF